MRIQLATVDLRVETESLDRTSAGTISGVVYLLTNGTGFPEAGWNDLIVAVLAAFLRALGGVRGETRRRERVCFMDGPFSVDIERTGDDSLGLVFREDRRHGSNVGRVAVVRERDLTRAVLRAADLTIVGCRRRGWEDADLEDLRALREETLMRMGEVGR